MITSEMIRSARSVVRAGYSRTSAHVTRLMPGSPKPRGVGTGRRLATICSVNCTHIFDDRLAGRRQVDVGGAPPLDPAAAVTLRTARSLDDRFRRGRDPGWRADLAAAVSRTPSFS